MDAEGDHLAHVTFFARAKREKSHEVKIFLRTSFEPYLIPRELNNHIKVMILKLDWCLKINRITVILFYFK